MREQRPLVKDVKKNLWLTKKSHVFSHVLEPVQAVSGKKFFKITIICSADLNVAFDR